MQIKTESDRSDYPIKYNKIYIQNDIKISTRSAVPQLYYVSERKTTIFLFMEEFANEIGNKWQVIVEKNQSKESSHFRNECNLVSLSSCGKVENMII